MGLDQFQPIGKMRLVYHRSFVKTTVAMGTSPHGTLTYEKWPNIHCHVCTSARQAETKQCHIACPHGQAAVLTLPISNSSHNMACSYIPKLDSSMATTAIPAMHILKALPCIPVTTQRPGQWAPMPTNNQQVGTWHSHIPTESQCGHPSPRHSMLTGHQHMPHGLIFTWLVPQWEP